MSLQCWHETTRLDTDTDTAQVIAGKLCRHSLAWARVFAFGTCPAQTRNQDARAASRIARIEDEMFVEVLAYSLCLLEMRLSKGTPAQSADLATGVRRECYVLVGQSSWRRRNRLGRLPAPDPTLRASRYKQLYPPQGAGGAAHSRLTREMFEQFSRCTGLGSEVLVGSGENLASLVFYIALHSVLSAHGLPTREAVLNLLRAARECRAHLQRAIPQMLAAKQNPRPSAAARPYPRPALPGPRRS